MKLVIGGTQFGMNYGFNNKKKIIKKEVKIIENLIAKYKINHIDTAPSYGNSEAVIGKSKLNKLNIITKLKLDNIKVNNKSLLEKEIYSSIYNSQSKLKNNLYGLFLHDNKNLIGPNGKFIVKILNDLKKKKVVKHVGISVYEAKDLKKILKFWNPDMVQFPFNVLDQRFFKYGLIKKLKKNKTKIFARSCFLQGLLLCDPNSIQINKSNKKLLLRFNKWCLNNGISKNQACINFVKKYNKFIDYLILGFNDSNQLKNNIKYFFGKQKKIPNLFTTNKTEIIDPRKW